MQGSPRRTCNPFFINSFTLSLTSVPYPLFSRFWTPNGHQIATAQGWNDLSAHNRGVGKDLDKSLDTGKNRRIGGDFMVDAEEPEDEGAETTPSEEAKAAEIEQERGRLLAALASSNPDTVVHKVAWILNNYPDTRNSDITLQLRYWGRSAPTSTTAAQSHPRISTGCRGFRPSPALGHESRTH